MVREHKIGTTVINIGKDVIVEFFGLLIKDYRTLKQLYADIGSFEADRFEDDEFLEILSSVNLVSTTQFKNLAKLRACSCDAINIYFSRTIGSIVDLQEMLENIVFTYSAPDIKEAEEMSGLVSHILSVFCFILGNEFGCFDTVLTKDSDDPVFDEVVYHYFSKFTVVNEQRHKMCIEFADEVNADSKKFKIHLDVFDEAPEKYDGFMAVVGPDIGAIDETLLTMKLVDAVLAGTMTVEQLVDECRFIENEDLDVSNIEDKLIGVPQKLRV